MNWPVQPRIALTRSLSVLMETVCASGGGAMETMTVGTTQMKSVLTGHVEPKSLSAKMAAVYLHHGNAGVNPGILLLAGSKDLQNWAESNTLWNPCNANSGVLPAK